MTELAPLSPFKEKFFNLFYRAAVSGALPGKIGASDYAYPVVAAGKL